MASELSIPAGSKMNIAYDVPTGKMPEFKMICTFAKALDESAFLISIPIVDGKPIPMDENQKFLIRYGQGPAQYILAAYPDDIVKEGIRRFWKMRRVTETRQFYQRKDERIKVALRLKYTLPTGETNPDGTPVEEDGMTMDISAGGLALCVNHCYDVGEVLEVTLPRIGFEPEGAPISGVIAVICWNREAPKGSLYRHITGLQFRMGEDVQREQIANYVAYVKRKFKL